MSKRPMQPSAHDVARLAGVSQSAVSRAFTPGACIAEATRDKVIRSAEILGYRPNLIARSLIKGRSGIIGVVISKPRYPFFFEAMDMLSSRLSKAGKHILVYAAEGDANVDEFVTNLMEFRPDALFLMASSISPRLALQCHGRGVPIISFSAARDIPGLSSVSADHLGGSMSIAKHLLEQGYRRPALLAVLTDNIASQERERGFIDYLNAQGVPLAARAVATLDREGAVAAARALLSRKDRPDAIFCTTDDIALDVIEVARFEYGLEIGRDLGIAGFDDIEEASRPSYDLTSFSVPVDQMMGHVTTFLLGANPDQPEMNAVVTGELKPRGSTRRS